MATDILAACVVLAIWVLALYGLYGLALVGRGWRRRWRLRRLGRLRFERGSLWLKN
jgi:hypothetical protein